MSLSAEYCEEKACNRDGGALAQQRKLICGLLVWSTLLTLGLATSIIYVQLILRASQDHAKPEVWLISTSYITNQRCDVRYYSHIGGIQSDHCGLMTQDRNWGQIQKCVTIYLQIGRDNIEPLALQDVKKRSIHLN